MTRVERVKPFDAETRGGSWTRRQREERPASLAGRSLDKPFCYPFCNGVSGAISPSASRRSLEILESPTEREHAEATWASCP